MQTDPDGQHPSSSPNSKHRPCDRKPRSLRPVRSVVRVVFRGLCVTAFLFILGLAALAGDGPVTWAVGETIPTTPVLYMPLISAVESTPVPSPTASPTPSTTPTPPPVYDSIPTLGAPLDHPPDQHGDLNLTQRGYRETSAALTLVDLNGPTDDQAPQLAGLFNHQRGPDIVSVFQVYDWNWACGEHGCRGDAIEEPPVTLMGLRATVGDPVFIPTRNPEIYGGGYKALVLYATPERITLAYTREDTAAVGYVVHIEEIAVEPTLVALYQQLDAEGRDRLPALRNGERLGDASSDVVKVVIRDTGSFMDPRSRKDWWVGY